MEQPGHRKLGDCRVVPFSHMIQRTARFGEVAGSYRVPRYEPEIVRFAVIQHVFVFAISEVIPATISSREAVRTDLPCGDGYTGGVCGRFGVSS